MLYRASRRFLLEHPWQLGLAVLGIALGVGVVVSIDLAKASAEQAFALSTEAVAGKATHRIVGGPEGLAEALYIRLRLHQGGHPAAPVIEGYASLLHHPGETLRVLGVDPFAERPFRNYWESMRAGPSRGSRVDLSDFVTRPGAALMSEATARRVGIEAGTELVLRVGTAERRIRLFELLTQAGQSLDGLLIMDIASAQELFGMVGMISHIDLIVPSSQAGERRLERIREILPPGAELLPSGTRGQAIGQMTRAFYENLMALSLLALLVGIFLIYNTMRFIVVQRRGLIGTLRAMGVTRGEVFRVIGYEALLIGVLGTLVGLALGIGLGRTLMGLVTRTINDVYFVLTVRRLTLTPLILAKGVGLGLGATVLAAFGPALEAARVSPRLMLERSQLESRVRRAIPRVALGGLAAILLGGALLAVPGRAVPLGLAAMFAVILGCALLTPAATRILAGSLGPLLAWLGGVLGQMAARSVTASLSRTGIAIAALMMAVATTIGIGIMIGSLRLSVADWLHNLLRADMYVSAPTLSGGSVSDLGRDFAARLARLPGVAAISTTKRFHIETQTGIIHLVAYELAPGSYAGFRFKEGEAQAVWQAFDKQDALIVSEPYAYRHGLHAGTSLTLRTDSGPREFGIAGVYRDYSSDQGVVAMSRRTFERYWKERGISSIGLYAEPGIGEDTLRAAVQTLVEPGQGVVIHSNRAILEASLAIFDRSFAITEVLRLLVGTVAFLGILSALMAWQLERTRELGVLRACGVTPRQLRVLVIAETGIMGFIAGTLSLPVGSLMAILLVYVINRRSFGWSMEVHLDAAILLQGLSAAIIAALLAGVYPALRMARTSPAEALRTE